MVQGIQLLAVLCFQLLEIALEILHHLLQNLLVLRSFLGVVLAALLEQRARLRRERGSTEKQRTQSDTRAHNPLNRKNNEKKTPTFRTAALLRSTLCKML